MSASVLSPREVVAARPEPPAGWADTPLRDRLRVIRRFRHRLADHALGLAEAVRAARGAPVAETLVAELLPLADACRFLERQAGRILAPRTLGASGRPLWLWGSRAEIRREPLGTVLVIGPANYPLFLPGVQAVQALVAGNAVLLKPAEGTGAVARRFADLLAAAGLDPRLLRILPEAPDAVREALEAGVNKVVLTGSADTGRAVLRLLAGRLVPSVMELSSSDAAFVRADADLDLVTRALTFALQLRGGETCLAPRRVFVAREVAAPLESSLTAAVHRLGAAPTFPRALPRAAALLRDAVGRGARLLTGEVPDPARGMTPVVVADATPDLPLLQEDVFAPVLGLVRVNNDEEALAAAARCPYALGATIFGNERAARALAARVRAGVVVINDVIVPTADPRLPFGGRGESGFGLTRGAEGLLELTAAKVVIARRGGSYRHLEGTAGLDPGLLHSFLRASHGGSWRARLGGWRRAIGELLRGRKS